MTYVFGIMTIIYLGFVLLRDDDFLSVIISMIIGIAILSISKILDKKSLKFNLTKQERIFFAFYNTYDKLEKYVVESTNETKNDAIEALGRLSRFIDKWKTDLTPSQLADIPNSISKLLTSLMSMINTDNNKKISSLRDALYKMAEDSANAEPNMDALQKFNHNLSSLFTMTVSATLTVKYSIRGKNRIKQWLKQGIRDANRIKQWLTEHPRMLLFLIGSGMISGLLFIVMLPEKITTTVSTVYLGILAIVSIIYQFHDRKNHDHRYSSPSQDKSNSTKSYDIQIPPYASKHIDSPYVDPREYTASKDHPIVWQNNDEVFHTITSGTRKKIATDNDVDDGKPDGLFDKTLQPHERFEFTFEKEGIYHYYCKHHKCSEATIIVK